MTTFNNDRRTYSVLSKVTPLLKSQVTHRYLHALSMNEIVRKTSLSKGTVYNIIQDWMANIAGTNLEEIRAFTSEIRKSGITIEECAQGFRIIRLLKKFNINDEFDVDGYDEDEYEENLDLNADEFKSITNNNTSAQYTKGVPSFRASNSKKSTKIENNPIIIFLDHIYKNCEKLGITPNIMTEWIDDLLTFSHDLDTESDKDHDYDISQVSYTNNTIEKKENERKIRNEIPFISRVSFYVKQKKKSIQGLENIKILISKDIDNLIKQREDITFRLSKTIEKEEKVFSYFSWYDNLKKALFYEQDLLIDQEFGAFANAINDFKQYNFNVTKILTEYKHINSLRGEMGETRNQVYKNIEQKNKLMEGISSLEVEANYHRQTTNTFKELEKIGFGLKELKQLSNTVMESALANDIEVKESVNRFFIDLDKHYDNKLGFEKKVKELKSQIKDIENQIPGYKQYFEFQIGTVSSLSNLHENGITNIDIINMNQLFSIFRNNDFLSDPLDQNTDKRNGNNVRQNKTNETTYWQQFIAKLQRLKNINKEINKQISNIDSLNKQIYILNNNKQLLENAYTDAVSNLNIILSKIHQSLDAARQISEGINKKKIIPLPIVLPVFIKYGSSASNTKLDEKKQKGQKTDK